MRVRIASVQYLLRPIKNFEEFAQQVTFFVESAADYGSQFVLFPEFLTMQLLSYMKEEDPARAVRALGGLTGAYENLFRGLAIANELYIIGGTHPVLDDGQVYNTAHLFTPHGGVFQQRKVHLTRAEKGPYQMSRGDEFCVFETDYGKIAILVCYDVEFPEAARIVSEAGAEILFVPSCTDERQGFLRVRYCSHARAVENQIYVALTGTVGNLPQVPFMSTNYGQAAIITPNDFYFARDGLAAEGTLNQEQIIVSDVDLALLDERRVNGTVIPLNDKLHDVYTRVAVYRDKGEVTTKVLPTLP
ncbi:MAG TPA: carbon-nitrogen hydrolase family protein [Oscillatoriaceae cyanobacterium]